MNKKTSPEESYQKVVDGVAASVGLKSIKCPSVNLVHEGDNKILCFDFVGHQNSSGGDKYARLGELSQSVSKHAVKEWKQSENWSEDYGSSKSSWKYATDSSWSMVIFFRGHDFAIDDYKFSLNPSEVYRFKGDYVYIALYHEIKSPDPSKNGI